MVFIDSNIFMYASGTAHRFKIPSVAFLHKVAARRIDACINTEILQEVLHRYRSIGRWAEGKEVYTLSKKIVPVIIPMEHDIIDAALLLLDRYSTLYARDGMHAASCFKHGIETIVSYDKDFDCIERLTRIEPEEC